MFFFGSSLGTSIGFCNFLYQGAFRELSHRFRWRKFTGRFVGGDFVGRFFSCLQVFLSEAFFCLPKRIDLIRKKGGILRHDHIISVLTQLLWISYGSRSEMVGESSLKKKKYVLPHFLETSCIHP